MTLTYFTAALDLPPHVRAGDLVSLNDTHPDEPVMVHRPADGVGMSDLLAWLSCGALMPAIPPGGASAAPSGPSTAPTPDAWPRLRLLPRDDQRTA